MRIKEYLVLYGDIYDGGLQWHGFRSVRYSFMFGTERKLVDNYELQLNLRLERVRM